MRIRLRVAAGVACVVAVAAPAAGVAASTPITGNEFVARLDAARRLAETDAGHPSAQEMQEVRAALGLPLDVNAPTGTIHVPADNVLEGLRGTTAEDFRNADDRLSAMEDAAKAALVATAVDPARVAAALRASFGGIHTKPGLPERIRHDIWVLLVTLWERLTRAANRVPIPHGLLLPLVLTALGVVIVLLVRRFGSVVPERKAAGVAAARQRKTDWDRMAREAMARGDLVQAVRARYGALLAALAARGIVPETPSLTAGECRRAVASALPDAYPSVAKATSIFESVMYGRSEPTAEGVDTLAAAEQSVRAAA